MEVKHADGSVEKLDMPATSNVLQWFCDDNTKVSVRPSGTEPKIKVYYSIVDPSKENAAKRLDTIREKIKNIINA